MQRSLTSAAVIALLGLAYVGVILGVQRGVMYPRLPHPGPAPALPVGAETAWLGDAAAVEAWLLRPAPTLAPFPVVIFSHGNGELIDDWLAPVGHLTEAGLGVLLVEYPSYGRSGGKATQESITDTMVAAFDFLLQQPDVDGARIVAYGRSLGGGAACALGAVRPVAALVLESTFTSVAAAGPWYLPRALVLDPFDNLAVAASRVAPTLVLHGELDQVIPYGHGEALACAAGTPIVRMPCGHNDCPRPWTAVLRFLEEQGIVS